MGLVYCRFGSWRLVSRAGQGRSTGERRLACVAVWYVRGTYVCPARVAHTTRLRCGFGGRRLRARPRRGSIVQSFHFFSEECIWGLSRFPLPRGPVCLAGRGLLPGAGGVRARAKSSIGAIPNARSGGNCSTIHHGPPTNGPYGVDPPPAFLPFILAVYALPHNTPAAAAPSPHTTRHAPLRCFPPAQQSSTAKRASSSPRQRQPLCLEHVGAPSPARPAGPAPCGGGSSARPQGRRPSGDAPWLPGS